MPEAGRYRIAIVDPVGCKAGMDRYDTALGRCLRQAGHTVQVFSNFSAAGDGFEAVALVRNASNRLFSFPATLAGLYRSLVRCRQVDFVVMHFFKGGLADFLAALYCRLAGLRTILIVHEVTPVDGPRWRPFRKATLALHGGPRMVHNAFTLEQLVRLVGEQARTDTSIVPHVAYVDMEDARKDRSPVALSLPADPYLLFFGQWKRSKGLETLFAAMARKGGRHARLVIAGRPRDFPADRLMRLVRRHGLSDRVTVFARRMSDDERDHLFRHADAVVIPYLRGYQSGVMITAMSCSRLVIASDIEPHRALIRDGRNGFLFKTGDPESLAAAFGRIPGDGVLRKRIESAARETMRRHHGCKALNQLFGNLLKP